MLTPHLNCRAPAKDGVWKLARHQARALQDLVGPGGLLLEDEAVDEYSGDESPVKAVRPAGVVIPRTAAQVAGVMALAERDRIPLTPRGGGSGKVGGAIPLYGGLVVATHQLTAPLEIDPASRSAYAPAGHLLTDVQRAAEAAGLAYPPDPGSAHWATLGGTLATNAGGPSSMKYGVTSDYVLSVDVALPGGQVLTLGHQSPKGVVGLDVARLIVGSEGTLGVIVGARLRLVARAPARRTLLAAFSGPRDAMEGLAALIASGLEPRAAEFFDGEALRALRREAASAGPEGNAATALPKAGAALLIELDGRDDSVDAALSQAAAVLTDAGAVGLSLARSDAERGRLWAIRKGLSASVKAGFTHYVSEDVGLPPAHLADFVDYLGALRAKTGLHLLSYGHAGDGNLHVNILFNDPEAYPQVDKALGALFKKVIELGGTLSGEHGIGCAKLPWVPLEHSAEVIALQRRLKAAFDPHGIMNPGKLLP